MSDGKDNNGTDEGTDGGTDPSPDHGMVDGTGHGAQPDGPPGASPTLPSRRPATVEEAKALAHPLRLRILRSCAGRELTNKQLADRLGRDPATIHYHVKLLAAVGFLEAAPARPGISGALEKPYRATGTTWWLDDPLAQAGHDSSKELLSAFEDELRDAGPDSLEWANRFVFHLSEGDVAELERRILAVLDEYVATDDQRRDQPVYGGVVALHRHA